MRLSWAVGDITGKNTQRAAAAGLVMATALLSASGPRRSFLRRLRGARATALTLAAALVALLAAAQTEVWSATLTPAALETGILGCSNSIVDGECSDTSILSEDSFTHDSTDYSVTGLFVNADGALRLQIVPVITTATGALMVGSTSLVLAEADIRVGGRRQWTSAGASLTVGTDIAVKLITPDTTPPTVQNSVVSATGQLVYISFSEDVDQSNLPPASVFTVTVDGSAVTVSNVITDPDPMFTTTLGISVSPTIRHGQAVVVTYTDPTADNDANAIQDAAGNDVATFTTGAGGVQVVGNQSTVGVPKLASATVETSGLSLSLLFDEALAAGAADVPLSAFSVTADREDVTIAGSSSLSDFRGLSWMSNVGRMGA